jgi:hypothetical protein
MLELRNVYKELLFCFVMNGKKFLVIGLLGMFMFSMIGGVLAYTVDDFRDDVGTFTNDGGAVYEIIRPFLEAVFGEVSDASILLAKFLFAFIIFSVIWMSIKNVNLFGGRKIRWVVSLAVTLLSVRWIMSVEIIQAILLPYGALGITIISAVPFLLFFFVVKDMSPVNKKTGWIFFSVVFVGLWFFRSGGDYSSEFTKYSSIYLVTAILALAMVVFDKYIKKWFQASHASRVMESSNRKLLRRLRKEYAEIKNDVNEHGGDKIEANKDVDEIRATAKASEIGTYEFRKFSV